MKNKGVKRVLAMAVATVLVLETLPSVTVFAEETESTSVQEDLTEPQQAQRKDRSNSWRYKDGTPILPDTAEYLRSSSDAWYEEDGKFYNDQGEEITGAVAKGIDVSKWNGDIDWAKVKATDVDYAIIRCGYGDDETSQDDPYWKTNADACTKEGIPFGTYIYSYADSVTAAKSEANHVLRLIKGYDLSYPIYYDLEENSVREELSTKEIAEVAQTFCSIIEDAGYDVAVYANKDWFTNYLTDSYFDTVDHWVAQYNSTCTYQGEYSMWQCTDSGTVDGIDGKVDLNMDFGAETTNKKALTSDYNFYWVFAYRKDSEGNMLAGSAPEKYVYGKAQKCEAVTDLKAYSVSGGVKLTWTKSEGAEGYLVYGIRGEGSYGYIGMTTTGTTFTDKNALRDEYNFYWVFPYHTDGNGNKVAGGTAHYVYGRAGL